MTGVSRGEGIGVATAGRLIAAGTAVFTQGWATGSDPPAEASAAVEGAAGHLEADLADPAGPAAVFAAARLALGRVDVLVANHAATVPGTIDELTRRGDRPRAGGQRARDAPARAGSSPPASTATRAAA